MSSSSASATSPSLAPLDAVVGVYMDKSHPHHQTVFKIVDDLATRIVGHDTSVVKEEEQPVYPVQDTHSVVKEEELPVSTCLRDDMALPMKVIRIPESAIDKEIGNAVHIHPDDLCSTKHCLKFVLLDANNRDHVGPLVSDNRLLVSVKPDWACSRGEIGLNTEHRRSLGIQPGETVYVQQSNLQSGLSVSVAENIVFLVRNISGKPQLDMDACRIKESFKDKMRGEMRGVLRLQNLLVLETTGIFTVGQYILYEYYGVGLSLQVESLRPTNGLPHQCMTKETRIQFKIAEDQPYPLTFKANKPSMFA